uniref:Coenzyme Q3, methyltransferase n=1 Tax=Oryza meridionalis TaxID=40149 RepID=A0A0E0DX30_9ORYZ
MKIQCNACGAAEARVLCCADEAALCTACDEEVHAANKLAGKHQRVPLLSDDGGAPAAAAAPAVPKCDICQEASGYFFCLEDRALLCRDCDVSIHTVNSFVSVHQRFLLTGVQVGLDPADPVPPVADKHVKSAGGSVDSATKHLQRNPTDLSGENSASLPSQNVINGNYSRQSSVTMAKTGQVNWTMSNNTIRSIDPPPKYSSEESPALLLASHTSTMAAYSNQISKDSDRIYNLPFTGGNGSDSLHDWHVDEFFSNSEFGFAEHGSSKGDNAKPGSAGGSPQCRLAEGLFVEGLLGQVPDNPWTVPEVPSPPTASGLYWQNNLLCPSYDSTMFVPEISSLENSQNNFTVSAGLKRRRRQF